MRLLHTAPRNLLFPELQAKRLNSQPLALIPIGENATQKNKEAPMDAFVVLRNT